MGAGGPEARQLFWERYQGKHHLMTPKVIDYQMLYDNIAVETSVGTGIDHDAIYGVTVLFKCKTGKPVSLVKLDKLCNSRKEVEDYIKKLKIDLKLEKDRIAAIDKTYEDC